MITAEQITSLLRTKHSKDLFVDECKDGPSQLCSHLRMDAWTMTRSWAHPCVRAYEIKVTRGDFLSDTKWRGYLPCCNEFAFACPKGVISRDELPADVGLYYVSSNAKMMTVQRKPVYREVEIPESVWRYILMCRTKIIGEMRDNTRTVEYWREWLVQKSENRVLGHEIASEIRIVYERTKRENEDLKIQMKAYDSVKSALAELGLDGNTRWISPEAVRRQAARVLTAVPEDLISELGSLIRQATHTQEGLKKIRDEASKRTEDFSLDAPIDPGIT